MHCPPGPPHPLQGIRRSLDRRRFLARVLQAAGLGGLVAPALQGSASGLFASSPEDSPAPRIRQETPWGRLEEVADGIWALVSTPLEDATTLCNGGIVAGRDGVLLVEAYGSPEGLLWMARQARARTGRWPDRIVVTHYHGDHTAGLALVPTLADSAPPTATSAAPAADPDAAAHPFPRPGVLLSGTTRRLTRETARQADDDALLAALARSVLLPETGETSLDLGGRRVRLVSRGGHTPHDVTVEVADPPVLFCGDLVWNRFFPNYVDAIPSRLSASVAALSREPGTVYVPGHGPLATVADLVRYTELLERVQAAAVQARERGWSAAEAAAKLTLPGPLADWFRFSPAYPERAVRAWFREWEG